MYRVIRRRLGYPVTIAESADGKSGIEEAEIAAAGSRYWNYRVVEFADGDDLTWSICEVHYYDAEPYGYSVAGVLWDSTTGYEAGFKAELARIIAAFSKPVLTASEAGGEIS